MIRRANRQRGGGGAGAPPAVPSSSHRPSSSLASTTLALGLLLLSSSSSSLPSASAAAARPRSVNAIIEGETAFSPDPTAHTSTAFHRPKRPTASKPKSVLVHRRAWSGVYAPAHERPPADLSGRSIDGDGDGVGRDEIESSARRISRSTCSALESLRGGSSDRRYYDDRGYGDYGDDRHRGSGHGRRGGYDYDYGDDSAAQKGEGGGYEDDYYGDAAGGGGYHDERYYPDERDDDYGGRGSGRSRGEKSSPLSSVKMPQMMKTGNRKVGMMLLSGGAALTFLGVTLFFNKSLLRMGNLLFVAGVPLTLGPGRTAGYFLQPSKARATGCLAAGMFLVFVGWPVVGIALEIFGLLNLFGNMFPVAMALARNIPVLGSLLGSGNGGGGSRSSAAKKKRRGSDDDDYGYGADDYYGRGDDDYYGGEGGSRDDNAGYY